MIVTVSTVKDDLSNVQRFVRGNLNGGVDHMVVFLDDQHHEVADWLAAQDHVTALVTDESWWGAERPNKLNKRQIINANLALAALSRTRWAQWVFHIDADEVARIDRAVLAAVPRRRKAVRLEPLEVVSVLRPEGVPTWFKRLLSEDELLLVQALGLVEEPANSLYFRSHTIGKVGVRAGADVSLGIHKAMNDAGERIPNAKQPGLSVLHFESYSGDDFVRKWSAMVTSGPGLNFGEHRMRLARALACALEMDLDAAAKARIFTQLYQRHMEDDVDTLRDLGLLTEVDVLAPGTTPRSTARHGEDLTERLEALRSHPKAHFHPRESGPTA